MLKIFKFSYFFSETKSQLSVEVKEEGDEEVLVVSEEPAPVDPEIPNNSVIPVELVEESVIEPVVADSEPPIIPSVNNNRVRPNRRRRGARKNEKNKRSNEEDTNKPNSR